MHKHHYNDTKARQFTRSFLVAGTLALGVLATISFVTSLPMSPSELAVWCITWLLGSAMSLFLGAALVYASVGCWTNRHIDRPPVRVPSRV